MSSGGDSSTSGSSGSGGGSGDCGGSGDTSWTTRSLQCMKESYIT